MGKVLVTDTYLNDIADAIRNKNGKSTQYYPAQMASAINGISTGITPYNIKIIQNTGQTIRLEYDGGESKSVTGDFQPGYSPRIISGEVVPDADFEPGSLVLQGIGTPKFPINVTSDLTFYATPATYVGLLRVDLSDYATENIPNYQLVTTIPPTNLDYLRSGLKATNMMRMFYNCNALTTLPNLGIDMSECTSVFGLCYYCESMTSADLSWADTSHVDNFSYMFMGCRNLQSIKGVIDMSNCTTYYTYMFSGCTKLRGVQLRNLPSGVTPQDLGLAPGQYTIVQ